VAASADTVLVTGGTGFVGSHVTEALLRRGSDCVVLDAATNWPYPARWKATNEALLRGVAAENGRRLVLLRGDCASRDDVAAAFGAAARVHAVVHLAAESGVVGGRPEDTIRANVGGTCVVLDAARSAGVARVVLASSASVYGDRGEALGVTGALESAAADAPLSMYACSKRSAELAAHALSSAGGPPVTVLRLFTVYGPRGRPDMAPLRFVRDVLAGVPLTLHGEGGAWRDYIYIADATAAVLAALDAPSPARYDVINVAGGRAVTLRAFVSAVERATQRSAAVTRVPGRPGDVGGTFGDVSKAAALLGWAPRVSLEDGLRRTVDWWQSGAADAYRTDSSEAPTCK
jgi:UDP-glucuronate 4-epimerase